jgi:hypothetical protein
VRFEYQTFDGNLLPLVPVAFKYGRTELPPIRCLADTGATHSILPMELAVALGIQLDLEEKVETHGAGGGSSHIYSSPAPLGYLIRDPHSHLECQWHGPAFFSLGQRVVLLGHAGCLEKFDVLFRGPERALDLQPRFRTESIGRPKRRR